METNKIHKLIREVAIDELGFEIRSYSGRGMYGKTCMGIICENPVMVQSELLCAVILQIMSDAGDVEDEGEAIQEAIYNCEAVRDELVASVRVDSMGLSQILYWENIPFKEV